MSKQNIEGKSYEGEKLFKSTDADFMNLNSLLKQCKPSVLLSGS